MLENVLDEFSANVPKNEHTYIADNGLLHCSKHKMPVQVRMEHPIYGDMRTFNCMCRGCKAEKEEREQQEKQAKLAEKRRLLAFANTNMSKWTFNNDDGLNPQITKAMKEYADSFEEFKKDGRGLVLYGTVGTGKTYMAVCVANRLIDKGYRVKVTNIATLINKMQETFEGRQEVINSLYKYDLIVIDDLGTESNSAYRQEIVYNVIDSCYRAGVPMIVTTNLTAKDFEKPKSQEFERVSDRLLERCTFIEVSGVSRRRQMFKQSQLEGKKRLGL